MTRSAGAATGTARSEAVVGVEVGWVAVVGLGGVLGVMVGV